MSVYTTEQFGILVSNYSALTSIISGKSSFRTDIINEILPIMYRMEMNGVSTCFLWVPAHVGVEGIDQVDILAKQTLNYEDLQTPLSKAEAKTFIWTLCTISMAGILG